MLHQWSSGRGFEIASLFFFPGMGGVVSGHHVNFVAEQCMPQRIPVFTAFYRRIPFDGRSQTGVIILCEPQMMDADFSGDLFTGNFTGGKKRHLPGCG